MLDLTYGISYQPYALRRLKGLWLHTESTARACTDSVSGPISAVLSLRVDTKHGTHDRYQVAAFPRRSFPGQVIAMVDEASVFAIWKPRE